jgi:hypothetical protein
MNAVPCIVVGVDGFESSKAALRWAIHQAKLTGAVVDALTTWHIPPGVAPWRRAMTGGAGTIRRAAASALESETPP